MSVDEVTGPPGPGAAPTQAPEAPPIHLKLDLIQGLAVFGYHLPLFRFYFLRIDSPEAGRRWIGQLLDEGCVTTAVRQNEKPHPCLNLGFTAAGLAALGLPTDVVASFPSEFQQGIEKRAAQLGDTGPSAPENWQGGLGTPDVHAVLMLFARTKEECDQLTTSEEERLSTIGGLHVLCHQDAAAFPEPHESWEHFGFRDGISRVTLEGSGTQPFPGQPLVKPGEFVLGYVDETEKEPPLAHPDLQRNGTFLVYRKLEQDVVGFRRWVATKADELKLEPDAFMAKLVGRWPSGAPVVLSPDQDRPELGRDPQRNSDFDYAEHDPKGFICPVGSHIRRANPRGTLGKLERTRHLLMRRGLCYGPPLPEGAPPDDVERGIAGVFVNASISRQFEFVQQFWLNDRKLSGQTVNDKDPISGDHDGTADFAIPSKPFVKRLRGVPRFTTVRGGGYFFAPGINGLKFLAGRPAERGVAMTEQRGVAPGPGAGGGPAESTEAAEPVSAAPPAPAAPTGTAEPAASTGTGAQPGADGTGTATDTVTGTGPEAAAGVAGAAGASGGGAGGKVPGDIHSYITSIAKVIPERLSRLKMVLAALADPEHKSPVPLVGTIHFARWALIDNETRLLFTTNFDQSWDAYIERFVEVGSAGLDGIWSNCEGYPPGGAKDVEALKEFVRSTEVTNAFVYCAYPDSTVAEVQSALRAKAKFMEFVEEFQT